MKGPIEVKEYSRVRDGHDDGEALTALLESGRDANFRLSEDEWTFLHYAAQSDGCDTGADQDVRILIAHGADPNARANSMYGAGWTPLHMAIDEGQTHVCAALLAGGADPNAVTEDGAMPLYLAVECGTLSKVALVLAYGAELRDKEEGGESSLEHARGVVRIWEQILVEASGDDRSRAKRALVEHEEIVQLLEGLQAKSTQLGSL